MGIDHGGLGRLIAALLIMSPAAVQAGEWSGQVGGEYRGFFEAPLFPEQHDGYLSAFAQPEYRHAWDNDKQRIVFVASGAGGMDIEEIAAKHPEKILKAVVDPAAGLQGYQCREIGFALGLKDNQITALTRLMLNLYRLYTARDLTLVEINPLAIVADGALIALDAKVQVDDNALYRQKALEEMGDPSQDDPKEQKAREFGLSYIALEGNIGCMVNGAGLAMATMDLIKLHGGMPANFLDVGGGTTADKVAEAFKLILSDKNVKAILVNIFGGIVRCDLIAEGIIKAVQEVGIKIPVVVRLEGTNVEKGRELLEHSGLKIISADSLTNAAKQAVAAAGKQ